MLANQPRKLFRWRALYIVAKPIRPYDAVLQEHQVTVRLHFKLKTCIPGIVHAASPVYQFLRARPAKTYDLNHRFPSQDAPGKRVCEWYGKVKNTVLIQLLRKLPRSDGKPRIPRVVKVSPVQLHFIHQNLPSLYSTDTLPVPVNCRVFTPSRMMMSGTVLLPSGSRQDTES